MAEPELRGMNAEFEKWERLDALLDREEQQRKMTEMTDQEWTAFVEKLDRQYETPRDEWEADLAYREAIFQNIVSHPAREIDFKRLSDDILINIWERRDTLDPAIVRAAAYELHEGFPDFHATPALWHKLATDENYDVARASFEHPQRRIDVATPDVLERTQAYVRDRTEGIQQQQRQGELLRPTQEAAENTETAAANLRLKPQLPRM